MPKKVSTLFISADSEITGALKRGSGDATGATLSERGPVGGKGREKRKRPTRIRITGLGFV